MVKEMYTEVRKGIHFYLSEQQLERMIRCCINESLVPKEKAEHALKCYC